MKMIGIGTLLRDLRDKHTIYLITRETSDFWIAETLNHSPTYRARVSKTNPTHKYEVIA
jgi:hypothetical protein